MAKMNQIDFDLNYENLNLMLQIYMKALLAGHHSRYFFYLKHKRHRLMLDFDLIRC